MVTFRLGFSDDEMCSFFKRHDLVVTEVTYDKHVPVYHNRIEVEQITCMCVVNPHTRESVPVSVAFERVIFSVRTQLLLDGINKLTVLEALK
jgi:hypothetical protein